VDHDTPVSAPQALITPPEKGLPGSYRGRLAPTPTGLLHLGHARTFALAWRRAREAGGRLIYRDEDLDPARCRPEYSPQALDDLRWLGLDWDEGPDGGGPCAPYRQSEAKAHYRALWLALKQKDWIYPCHRSRKEVRAASQAPHEDEAEPVFPLAWRPPPGTGQEATQPGGLNWRFRVPEGVTVRFQDQLQGTQAFTAGVDFGDFLVWRKEGTAAYELAVVADDYRMGITEVVDAEGRRLAKRHRALSLQTLRQLGYAPETVIRSDPAQLEAAVR